MQTFGVVPGNGLGVKGLPQGPGTHTLKPLTLSPGWVCVRPTLRDNGHGAEWHTRGQGADRAGGCRAGKEGTHGASQDPWL